MSHTSAHHTSEKIGRPTHLPAWLRAALLCTLMAGSLAAANSYLVHNLVSDLPDTADHVDSNLVNPWGVAFSATSPFWVANNHTGTSTLYDGSGNPLSLIVQIPSPAGGTAVGAPTGMVFNGTQSFAVATGKPGLFLFCSEDGTIVGWNSTVDSTHGKILVDNSASGAIYKGCALGGTADAPRLYAADFHNRKIDVWDGNLQPVQNAGAFNDTNVPADFAPFNIANINGKLYVTYAKQDADKEDDIQGLGNGIVDVFDMTGAMIGRLVTQGPLNSPWGMVIAPAGFGDFGGMLLVGNFGDGMIHAFNPNSGAFAGTLMGLASPGTTTSSPIVIQGLWSLVFGNGGKGGDSGTLYFTAGIPGPGGEPLESHGLFGSIQAAPVFQATAVLNAASFDSTLAANAWVSIFGSGLSAVTRNWQTSDFVNNALPTELSGVTVTVNGNPAYLSYISPSQINVLIPADTPAGPIQIQVMNNGLASATVRVNLESAAPAFFQFTGTKYIAATHSDNVSPIGPPGIITGTTTTPAQPGEIVVLYANGFGETNPAIPNGLFLTMPLQLAVTPTVTIGGKPAEVKFAGLTAPGLYQFNVVVPTGLAAGDADVIIQILGVTTQAHGVLSIAATSTP
jgi:uncharacterized protein (TIGR03118 family)